MRILIITGIFPPDIGGPATYVPQIAKGLAEKGHDVSVITLSDRDSHGDSIYPFQVLRIRRGMFKPWRMLVTMWKILCFGRQADVLFVNGLYLESVVANELLRKPLVMKIVGDLAWERATSWGWTNDSFETFQQKRYELKIEILKTLRSWWTRKAHRIIVPSRYLAKWMARWGVPKDRITVIYNSVEVPSEIEPLPVPLASSVKIVTVGRLIPLKRVDGILKAISEVPGIGLIVVGDGPDRPKLERLVLDMGLEGRVYFAGHRNHKDTLRLIASGDVFVLNSTHEGLPHVVLEAMALGLPVVATAVGGTPEVVRDGETGILIPLNDGSLENTLRYMVQHPEKRKDFGAAGLLHILRYFTESHMAEQTEAVLNSVKGIF